MSSWADIANMAVSHLGVGDEIQDWETENTTLANAFRRFRENARDTMLRAFPWPFASRTVSLALIETDPLDEWGYSYRMPSGALGFWIRSGILPELPETRIAYAVASDATGKLIYTNQDDAIATYTYREDDPEKYDPDFVEALSYLIASKMALRVAGADKLPLQRQMMQMYLVSLGQAMQHAAREEVQAQPDSEFERARG